MWESREVRIDLAKNIFATPQYKVSCKSLYRPNAAACNATILVCAIRFFKKGSCVYLPCSTYWNLFILSLDFDKDKLPTWHGQASEWNTKQNHIYQVLISWNFSWPYHRCHVNNQLCNAGLNDDDDDDDDDDCLIMIMTVARVELGVRLFVCFFFGFMKY